MRNSRKKKRKVSYQNKRRKIKKTIIKQLKDMHNINHGNYWTDICSKLNNCDEINCLCYANYVLFSKDMPKLEFNQWKELVRIEYEQF